MCDQPVRTRVLAGGEWYPLQEFLIRRRGAGPVQDVEFRHASAARATPEILDALRSARAIIIGPSNPVISIGPILAVPGIATAIAESPAPVVAVSPLVAGSVLKGPTAEFLRWAGRPMDSDGIAALYAGLIDGLVADQPATEPPDLPTRQRDVRLDTPRHRREVAAATLDFALGLTISAPATSV
jgi:LPPG:FO 2-phospho-L-lactate transferase